jgi:septal ring factor EnvC (AmiA/AmiB activator)
MDPFSFGSAVFGTLELISQATIAVAKYSSSVKGAQRSRQLILKELSTISQTLTSLKLLIDEVSTGDLDTFDTDAAAAAEITTGLSTLEGAEGPLAECRQTVADLLAWLDRLGSAEMNLAQKLVWPIRDEKKVEEVLKKLEREKSQFTLALDIASVGMQNSLSRKADAITGRTESIYERVGDIANEQLRFRQENAEQERSSSITL